MPATRNKNWELYGQLFTVDIPKRLEKEARRAIWECARIYQREVIQMIHDDGHGTWRELSWDWLLRKERGGNSLETYRYQDTFLNYLESDQAFQFVKGKFAEGKIFFGARAGVMHGGGSKRPISMEKLAEVLQYEWDRPLFDPAYQHAKEEIKARFHQVMMKAFKGNTGRGL